MITRRKLFLINNNHIIQLSKQLRDTENMFYFKMKNITLGGIMLYKKHLDSLIDLGNIHLRKEDFKNESFIRQDENYFDYCGIENALCGKDKFTPKRILVIQMK